MKLYGLKNCDTCRKALKLLPEAQLIDVRSEGVPAALIEQALAEFGDKLVNSRSTTWRQMSPEQRDLPAKELLKTHPTLMKRPLIDADGTLYLGWGADVQAALGKP
ncbi:arsenate reductase [Cognatishimia sp. SS12]|uniref:ArsC/Spx/MgsR family protein n=1 Tax=Cognatishimia sp. SS12 TaxID=2979465 RepID=UPI00232D0580|nr:ArsC/Spx/MgsR family protein [Cognatishimia sp. SS12]MDC0736769.1 arsenate reductase [Cognatishimia sp. SS12]